MSCKRQVARRTGVERGKEQERAGLIGCDQSSRQFARKVKAGVEVDGMHLLPALVADSQGVIGLTRGGEALWTKCVMRPTAVAAAASSSSHASRLARSPTKANPSSGRAEALTAAVTVSSRMSANTVRTPSPTRACAIARPIRFPPPHGRLARRNQMEC